MNKSILAMTLSAGLMAAPGLVLAQTATTAPPATTATPAPVTPTTNPPGTAVGRAMDRAATSVGNGMDRAANSVANTVTPSTMATGPTGALLAERPRMSKVIGSSVYNDQGQKIGKIEDVVMTGGTSAPMAIIEVGGFLGMGGHLVSVPVSELGWQSAHDRVVMAGATKDSLKARPAYEWPASRHS